MQVVNSRQKRAGRGLAWPLERVLSLLTGVVTTTTAGLAAAVSPWLLLVTAFVGINQLAFAAVGDCPM